MANDEPNVSELLTRIEELEAQQRNHTNRIYALEMQVQILVKHADPQVTKDWADYKRAHPI